MSLVGLIFLFIIWGAQPDYRGYYSSTHQSPELKYTAPTYSIFMGEDPLQESEIPVLYPQSGKAHTHHTLLAC